MLTQRIWSALLAGFIVLLALVLGGVWAWRATVFIATALCVIEFAQMFGQSWRSPLLWWGVLLDAALQADVHTRLLVELDVGVAVTLLIPVVWRNRVSITESATVTLGALYLGFGGAALGSLRATHAGLLWVWLVLIVIWVTDTAAYFAGGYFQGPKLWPSISPKKTVSGAVAGVVAAALSAVVIAGISGRFADWVEFALLAVVISLCGQLGDLIESAYKRSAGVKDSGKLLPGHGGMLDRVDGLLFAAPFAWFLITASVLPGIR